MITGLHEKKRQAKIAGNQDKLILQEKMHYYSSWDFIPWVSGQRPKTALGKKTWEKWNCDLRMLTQDNSKPGKFVSSVVQEAKVQEKILFELWRANIQFIIIWYQTSHCPLSASVPPYPLPSTSNTPYSLCIYVSLVWMLNSCNNVQMLSDKEDRMQGGSACSILYHLKLKMSFMQFTPFLFHPHFSCAFDLMRHLRNSSSF